MSRSRKLKLYSAQIEDMRTILNSMKNLAFMETHKLGRFLMMQGQVVAGIEQAAKDFLRFYPYLPGPGGNAFSICILMGSERGFCGDFNERLLDSVAPTDYSAVIAIGSRLISRLENKIPNAIATLAGASMAEEVPAILDRLIETISSHHQAQGFLALTVVYQDYRADKPVHRQVLPPVLLRNDTSFDSPDLPPMLNLEPADFFSELIDHYLFAALHEIVYVSLMAENQSRCQHLEGAVQHLDDEINKLRRTAQIYRQEEITEEIEVILLNSENH